MSSKATGPGDLTLGPQPFPGPAALATWGLLRGFSPCLAALSIHSSFISKLLGNGKQDLGFAHSADTLPPPQGASWFEKRVCGLSEPGMLLSV